MIDRVLATTLNYTASRVREVHRKELVKPTILVVDQDYSVIEDLQSIIAGLGFEFQFATSAQKAIKHCSKVEFDMLIIDLNLQDQSGLKVIQDARVPFMVLAESIETTLVDACINSGSLLSFLTKPLKEQVLVETAIKAALANALKQRTLKVNLDDGVKTTYYVNTAKGILMERFKISDEKALSILQHENKRRAKKILNIAQELVDQVNKRYEKPDHLFDNYYDSLQRI